MAARTPFVSPITTSQGDSSWAELEARARLEDTLRHNNQTHLTQFLDELTAQDRSSGSKLAEHLLNDLAHIDFDEVTRHFARLTTTTTTTTAKSSAKMNGGDDDEESQIEPVPGDLMGSSTSGDVNEYERLGLEAIARGQVAVLLLAGGQGTRLGGTAPKGMYSELGLLSHKTLYQLQAERLMRVQQLASSAITTGGSNTAAIPWYIMTSEHTKELTEQFFAEHAHFGLAPSSIRIFEQYMLPCLSKEGKILLDQKWKVPNHYFQSISSLANTN
jgi:UDP-N-acetylglucosamine/UDP-N-acetylgalactosamine diphosphorylase